MEFANKIGAKYYETSALTDFNKNCKVVFQSCAHMIMNNILFFIVFKYME